MANRVEPFVRLDFLDALRCFAALYVVVYHMVLIPEPDLQLPEWIRLYASHGGTGVSLFFVLSAFALSYSLDARRHEPRVTRRFYLRRLLRIAPLFYVMMFLYYIRDIFLYDRFHSLDTVLINASLFFNLFPDHIRGYVWASWTIGVEILFYLLFPILHHYIRTLTAAATLFLVAVLLAQGWTFFIDHFGVSSGYLTAEQIADVKRHGFLHHLPLFICGILAYRLFFDHLVVMSAERKRQYGLLFLVLFVFLYTALLTGHLNRLLWDGHVWQGICYAILILGLGLTPLRLLVNPLTVRLGKVSYSLYLLHPTLVFALAPVYYWLYDQMPNRTSAFALSFLVTVLLLATMSIYTYRYVERVGIAWGEALIKRGEARARGSGRLAGTGSGK